MVGHTAERLLSTTNCDCAMPPVLQSTPRSRTPLQAIDPFGAAAGAPAHLLAPSQPVVLDPRRQHAQPAGSDPLRHAGCAQSALAAPGTGVGQQKVPLAAVFPYLLHIQ